LVLLAFNRFTLTILNLRIFFDDIFCFEIFIPVFSLVFFTVGSVKFDEADFDRAGEDPSFWLKK